MMHQEEEPERMDKPVDYGTAPLLGGEAVKQALDDSASETRKYPYIGTVTLSDGTIKHAFFEGSEDEYRLRINAPGGEYINAADLPSDAYRFDHPPSPYRVWHGIIPPPADDARADVVTTTSPNTLADFPRCGAGSTPQREESASACQHRSRLIRSGMELCDDGCGAVLGDGVTLAPIIDSEPPGNTGELDPPSRSGKGDLFRRIAKEIGDLVASKNEAYGSSFSKTGDFLRLLYPGQITEDQYDDALLMVRMFDKQMRIANEKDAFEENPYRDIAGYGICGASMSEDEES